MKEQMLLFTEAYQHDYCWAELLKGVFCFKPKELPFEEGSKGLCMCKQWKAGRAWDEKGMHESKKRPATVKQVWAQDLSVCPRIGERLTGNRG